MTMQRQPDLNDPEPGWNNARRTAALRREPRRLSQSAATLCEDCGGFLAESDSGAVWCLQCEENPDAG